MDYPITAAAAAAVLLILQQVLMLTVGITRGKQGLGVGDGNDPDMLRKIRRHGNLAENAAIFVVTLALLEMLAGAGTGLTILAALFVGARVLHAIGFSNLAGSHGGEHKGPKLYPAARAVGATLTALTGIAAGGWLGAALLGVA